MPMYEIELRRRIGDTEVRLTDRALAVGDELSIGGRRWRVHSMVPPERSAEATVRYICHELRIEGEPLRAAS